MKKIVSFLALLFLLLPSVANAYDAKIDGIYYNFSGDNAEVTYQKYQNYTYTSDYSGTVVIPKSVSYNNRTYNVTSIGDWAFSDCSSLTEVTIPNSVTSIGDDAFYGCSGLTSATIPKGVTYIGNSTFSGCSGLTSVTIPNSVTSIGDYAFADCSSLQKNEYDEAFYLGNDENPYVVLVEATSTDITACDINAKCKFISSYAFSCCEDLTEITIPESVTSIGGGAFEGCSGLTSVIIPNSVTSIGDQVFDDCYSLQHNEYDEAFYLGNEGNPYVALVMAKSTDITACNINTQCKFILSQAFWECSSLESVTIPNSVTSIGNSAFFGCSSLESVTIPNSVTSIGNSAFFGCI